MRRLLEFFRADKCVLLEHELQTDDYFLRHATAEDSNTEDRHLEITEDVRLVLPEFGRAGIVLCNTHGKGSRRLRTWSSSTQKAGSRPLKEELSTLSEWLNCRSFISVPLRHYEWHRGYLLVSAVRPNAFRLDDAKFLMQLADQVTPVLEHIRLVDHMASGAAENERRRIARSVHDRVIQPYIGLQMGLLGVSRALNKVLQPADPTTVSPESQRALASLESVVEMARQGVEELRQYVSDLRQTKTRGDVLLDSLLRYAAKFETVTGIQVSVTGDRIDSWNISDRLAGEIFQMATEALSNVHRHTTATAVNLSIERNSEGKVTVRIENEIPDSAAQPKFFPQSIAERATALGGRTEVCNSEGRTVVRIEIPL
jgi:signal transduction histidine kinase